MASFRRGAEAIVAAKSSSGGGKFTPIFKFESGETKYIQFLMPIEEVVTTLMHQFITVGYREDGSAKYERFISRRDPNLDGPEGYDELIDRFGSQPSTRCIALAVELEPQFVQNGKRKTLDGFDVSTRQFESNGETKEVPNVAFVIESPHTLYGHLAVIADTQPIEDIVLAVTVSGKGKDKQFTVVPVGEAIDFDGELDEFIEEFDFDAQLEQWADEDRMREIIGPLADDFVVNKWAKKKGDKSEASSSGRSTRSRRQQVEEPDEDGEDEPQEQEEKPATRSRRFSALKKEMAAA